MSRPGSVGAPEGGRELARAQRGRVHTDAGHGHSVPTQGKQYSSEATSVGNSARKCAASGDLSSSVLPAATFINARTLLLLGACSLIAGFFVSLLFFRRRIDG